MNSQTKNPAIAGLGFSKNVRDANLNAVNYIKSSHKTQPKFTVADVDSHLRNFNNLGSITKRIRMIAWLHLCSINYYAVTRFDALSVGCSCWKTTASEIGTRSGLKLERRDTTRKTLFRQSTLVNEYWFDVSELTSVVEFLGGYRQEAA